MSHRASFPQPDKNNEFWIETQEGWIYDTATENVAYLTSADLEKFFQHHREGYHPECVNCPNKDPRTPAQRDADQHDAEVAATNEGVRP